MFDMELKSSKGISWVDNMYQKIGVIYKGVDDNKFFQETSKFVECQVQTVGVNLQKFCAEIVHEFLSPPLEDPAKGPPTDSSLNRGKDIACHGKVKEGLEEFPPLVEDMPHLTDSVDEIREINEGGTYDTMDPPSQPKVLQCQCTIKKNPSDADVCSKCYPDTPSSSSIILNKLAEKASTSEDHASDVTVTSLPAEAEIRASASVAQPVNIVYHIVEEQEKPVLLQDTFPSASSGFTVDSKNIKADDSTKCEDRTVAQNFLSHEASQHGKTRQTGRSAEVIRSTLFPAVNLEASQNGKRQIGRSAKVEDVDYEQVAFWYRDIDSEMKHSKEVSPLNQIHDSYMDKFVNIDSCESEWELL